jgi:hypothetical protein
MPRRDAFSDLREPANLNEEARNIEEVIPNVLDSKPDRQPLDSIPMAQPRRKRERAWELAHRSETVTYRSVPPEYQQLLVEIAQSLAVPRDEVVRAFLEYGVEEYNTGRLTLFAHPKAQRMTLFPEGGKRPQPISPTSEKKDNWLNQAFPTQNKKGQGKANKKAKGQPAEIRHWQLRVTYRIPVELKEAIKAIANKHWLPVGEIVVFFIEQALKAFRDGSLLLQPVPKMAGKTLFKD